MRGPGRHFFLAFPLAPSLACCADLAALGDSKALDLGQNLSGLPIDKILQTGGALVLVLIVIATLAWILRRYNRSGRNGQGELALLGGLALGGRERLMLVRAGQDRVLIGVAPGQIRALHVLSRANDSGETRTEPTGGFEKTLNGILASDRP